jgi:hypothetical protein
MMLEGDWPKRPRPWSGGGREELAAAVRHLMTATVAAAAPPEVLADAARRVEELAAELDVHVPGPDGPPTGRFAERDVSPEQVHTLAASMPFDMIVGTCNPVALPITVTFEPPKALGEGTFTAPFEGAPGCVHGAALAASFDIMLTAANVIAGAAGPTVDLTIRYRKPTLVDHPCHYEAWVTEVDGRRTYSRGHLIQDGVVTVEAEGVFVNLERDRIAAMHKRPGAGGPDGDGSATEGSPPG